MVPVVKGIEVPPRIGLWELLGVVLAADSAVMVGWGFPGIVN